MKLLREILKPNDTEPEGKGRTVMTALHGKLTEHYDKKKYDSIDLKHLEDYTAGDTLSHQLWDSHTRGVAMSDSTKNITKGMDEALNQVKTPRSFHVYSNTKMDPRQHINKEGIVHHPAYMSTTINPTFAKNWWLGRNKKEDGKVISEKHILKIRIPKGHSGSYVGEHISSVPHQHEFILPRGTNMRYHGTTTETRGPTKYDSSNVEYRHHIHHMEIVP